jgi:2-keto-4-pentenoate hydratase/2-oxohepta-3-ene-1,7-dioic acid hydratase in catechol pathway
MRLYFFAKDGEACVGIEKDGYLSDVTDIAGDDLITIIEFYDEFVERINEIELEYTIKIEDVKLLAPYYDPQKIICIGKNYLAHCEEAKAEAPKKPVVFSKYTTAIIGPDDFIIHPEETTQLDFEGELAVIIGKEGKRISKENAFDYIFGYSIMNDVSARDLQFSEGQWVRSKSLDTFGPFGPCLVTKDEISDPQNLTIKTTLNGELMQDGNTNQMIFRIPELIEFISRNITLVPGDIISTGTPSGVGHFHNPPKYLLPNSTIEVEIDKIGVLRNKVVEDK